jgi:hypothetical protein
MDVTLELPLRPKCKATNRDGRPCGNWAAPFMEVCRNHGAEAPQVIRAQQIRIALASEPAITALVLFLEHACALLKAGTIPADMPSVIRAATEVLNRCGLASRTVLQLTDERPGLRDITTEDLAAQAEALALELRKSLEPPALPPHRIIDVDAIEVSDEPLTRDGTNHRGDLHLEKVDNT